MQSLILQEETLSRFTHFAVVVCIFIIITCITVQGLKKITEVLNGGMAKFGCNLIIVIILYVTVIKFCI